MRIFLETGVQIYLTNRRHLPPVYFFGSVFYDQAPVITPPVVMVRVHTSLVAVETTMSVAAVGDWPQPIPAGTSVPTVPTDMVLSAVPSQLPDRLYSTPFVLAASNPPPKIIPEAHSFATPTIPPILAPASARSLTPKN